ncbi:MAG: hypothetical protein ACRDZ4_03290 [Egibacteraceae bacterium]
MRTVDALGLSTDELDRIDRCWRAANPLLVGPTSPLANRCALSTCLRIAALLPAGR